ncbi:MAG: hypothetical protein SAL70_32080 [Scytonema sp. PMC 1070.18]|nr:hypothetical protein [Scytonema sp. PMC 1070.18]
MYLPILILHRGYSTYLMYCLAQAKALNPDSDVILLGNESNKHIDFVFYENIEKYDDEAKEFEKIYSSKHMSFSEYQYELFCFQRWFILKRFLEKNNLDRCIHLDSDVMIYVNLLDEFSKKFEKFNFTLSKKGSGHNSFIKYQGIENFCQLLTNFYTDPGLYEILKSIREKALSAGQKAGGICDMTLLNQYYQRYSHEIGITSDIIDDSVYDANINNSDGFEMYDGIKKIYWVDGHPVCKHLNSGREIRFNSLHFQGQSKKYIKNYFTGNNQKLNYYQFKYKVSNFLDKYTIR